VAGANGLLLRALLVLPAGAAALAMPFLRGAMER
jgi:hypothetical protein